VHDYPGGLPVIAVMMDMPADTLRKKLDPAQDSHKLMLAEAMHILRITRDDRILDAICHEAGAVWVRPDAVPACPADLDVLGTSTALMDRAVRVITELEQALHDGEIDADERARLDASLSRLSRAAHLVSETAARFQRNEESDQ
jgi:hypothetical protein